MANSVQALIATYQRAQERIIKAILANKSVAFNSAMLRSINKELAVLQGKTVAWVERAIPAAYRSGMDSVNRSYVSQYADAGAVGPAKYPTEFATLNRNAIKVLVQNTQADFDKALGFVGRRVQDDIRQAGLQAVADKVASGTTVDKMRKILAEKYAQQGLAAIKYQRQGKDVFMSLDAYAGLIARTTTAEATNTASINQNKSIGGDLMQLTSHASACPICMPLEGRVYSVDGKDPDYPPLSTAFSSEYATIHPNCGHRLVPYIVDFKDEAQLEADRKFSNRSFDVGDWPQAERERAQAGLDAYRRGQAKSRALYTDRRQYERYKAALGDGAPKSFSGFRAMKKADGENWRELSKKYRSSAGQVATKTSREAAEKLAREAAEKAAKELAEKLAREAAEKAAREAAEKVARRKAQIKAAAEKRKLAAKAVPAKAQPLEPSVGNIRRLMGDHVAEETKYQMKNAPESIKKVWNHFEPNLKFDDISATKTGCYDPSTRGITFNAHFDRLGSHYNTKMGTLFHESGHYLDFNRVSALSKTARQYQIVDVWKNADGDTLRRLLRADYYHVWEDQKKLIGLTGHMLSETESNKVVSAITAKLKMIPDLARRDVSDILEGMSEGKIRGGYGHGGAKYWLTTSVQTEAFAEMFHATINNPASVTELKRYFPRAYEGFMQLMDELAKKLK